ncbi:MAG: hypothetical protein FJ293_03310 [Planctomycetes bacterium]|nr:hypothetical protein [Planctomycetota bacterium]
MNGPLRCPQCAGILARPGQARCEWCGATLTGAEAATRNPAERDAAAERARFEATLAAAQQQAAAGARRVGGAGCAVFVLVAAVLLTVFVLLFLAVKPNAVHPSTPAPVGPERPQGTPSDRSGPEGPERPRDH